MIPAALRASRDWKAGTRFSVVVTAEGVSFNPLPGGSPFEPTRLEDVFGMARRAGPALTVEQMDTAVAAKAARRR